MDATVQPARMLRRRLTDAEPKLWLRLRDRRLGGHRFVRQVPIGRSVADFVCREAKLVIEVDGSGHARNDRDDKRDAALGVCGYRICRFWNPEVLSQVDHVCETIVAALDNQLEPLGRFIAARQSRPLPTAWAPVEEMADHH